MGRSVAGARAESDGAYCTEGGSLYIDFADRGWTARWISGREFVDVEDVHCGVAPVPPVYI
eukprot:scaffold89530_cov35-Tisochrysis_lutea.AAC.4